MAKRQDAVLIPFDRSRRDVETKPGRRARKTRRSQGSVYERNGRWYLKFRVTDPHTGIRCRKTEAVEGATRRSEALQALERRLTSIADRSYFAESRPRLTFDAVSAEFLAWARLERRGAYNYEIALRDAKAAFGGMALAEVSLAALEAFRTNLVSRLVAKRIARHGGEPSDAERRQFISSARATCNRRMSVIRRMFNRLVELEQIGAGEPTDLPEVLVKFKKGNPHSYKKKVNIPANSMAPGIYRIYATFKVKTTNDPSLPTDEQDQTPVAGFVDLGTINYYQAK